MRSATGTLGLFARAPNLGEVKSRLAAVAGQQLALAAHVALVGRAVQQIQLFNHSSSGSNVRVQLWLAGEPEDSAAEALVARWAAQLDAAVLPQQGAGLGERMAFALDAGVAEAGPTVVVGADCPGITAGYLSDAFSALAAGESVVLGPAEDGGYGLLGVTHSLPTLLQQVDWGTSKVLSQTLARCAELGIRPSLLPTIWDVDEWSDWQRYCREYSATL